MRVCSSILVIASIGLMPGSGLAQDNLPAAPSATREQRKPQSAPATDPAKTDNSTQQEQSNVAPKPADVSAASRTSSGPTADEDAATTIRVPVNEVNVIFTVTDKHGRYVKDLKKSDFNVVDDSKPAAEIRSFHNETDLPLQVGLLVDARYFACRDKLLKAQRGGPTRRAIILLSDGDDNQSHVTREESIDMAQRAEVIVYTISTNITGTRARGDKVLERIADATGGRAFFPFQITDVANAFIEIQDELRSQYALSYKPADFHTDGRYHTIEILAQNHKGLRV